MLVNGFQGITYGMIMSQVEYKSDFVSEKVAYILLMSELQTKGFCVYLCTGFPNTILEQHVIACGINAIPQLHHIDCDCNLDWYSMQVLLFMSPEMILWPVDITEHYMYDAPDCTQSRVVWDMVVLV